MIVYLNDNDNLFKKIIMVTSNNDNNDCLNFHCQRYKL